MTMINEAAAFNRGTDPILNILTVEQAKRIVSYRAEPSLKHRIDELAVRANEGELTPDERAEYEGYIKANKFIAVLQVKARKILMESED